MSKFGRIIQQILTKLSLWDGVLWLEEAPGGPYVRHLPLSPCVTGGESSIGLLPVVIILHQFLLKGRGGGGGEEEE